MRTTHLRLARFVGACIAAAICTWTAPAASQNVRDSATVPLFVVGNRPYVDVTLHSANGATRIGRFLLDSGAGAFILSEPLARDLGLAWGDTIRDNGKAFALITNAPSARVGAMALDLHAARVAVELGTDRVLTPAAPGRADGMIPGSVLAQYHVVFNYPKGTWTFARAGVLTSRGTPFPMPVDAASGYPRTEVQIDGITYGFLIDTGASFTMVSEVQLKAWGATHPAWRRYAGPVGDAVTLGGLALETMFVIGGHWDAQTLPEFGVVSQPEGTFERSVSGDMTAPVIGSLAGNVLKNFRVELDYPNQRLYLSKP